MENINNSLKEFYSVARINKINKSKCGKVFSRFVSKLLVKRCTLLPAKCIATLSRILLLNYNYPVTIKTNQGFKIIVDSKKSNDIIAYKYSLKSQTKGTLFFIKKMINPNDIFLDIGAGIGISSIYASLITDNRAKIYSFESNPLIFDELLKNMFVNNTQNINPFNFAFDSLKAENSIDYFVQKNSIDKIKMIKIDNNGNELDVLKSAKKVLKSKKPPIICIKSLKNSRFELFKFLKEMNSYKLYKINRSLSTRYSLKEVLNFKDMPKNGNIFCLTYSSF